MTLDIEAFMREAFENLKVQVEVEEKLKMERKLRRTMIEEEETSRQMWVTNEVTDTKDHVVMTALGEKVWNKSHFRIAEKQWPRIRSMT